MKHSVFLTNLPAHVALRRNHPNKPKNGWNLDDPSFRHRAVMGLFGGFDADNPRLENGILFRFETIPGQAPYFLVQSFTEPNSAGLSSSIQVKKIHLPLIGEGKLVRFRVAVNAIQRKGKGGVRPIEFNSKNDSEFYNWLTNKLSPGIESVEIVNHTRSVLGVDRRGNLNASKAIQIDTVDGVAMVADPVQLNEMILKGIGRAKSYGCGLLSVQELN